MLLYNCKEQITSGFIEILKKVFIYTLVLFLISTFTYYFLTEPFYTFKSTIIHYHTLVDLRILGYEIHSIYLSMHIGVAILFFNKYHFKNQKNKSCFSYNNTLLLLIFLAILNKRGPIISLGVIGFLYILKTRIKPKIALSILALSSIFVLSLIFIPKFNNINRF